MRSPIARGVVGFFAGALWWLLVEPSFPKNVGAGNAFAADAAWIRAEAVLIIGLFVVIGGVCGALQGLSKGSRTHFWQSLVAGLAFALVGAFIGRIVSGAIFSVLMTAQVAAGGGANPSTIVRTLTFAPLGLMLGAAVGGTQFSLRGLSAGVVGGLIGGVVTGMLFDPISTILAAPMLATDPGSVREIGAPGRAVMCAGIGLFVSLFTALADQLSRKAWVRQVLGRNEGREWTLDNAVTYLGRDERAGIPLFGDPDVAPHHATIRRQGGAFVLEDAGAPSGIGHNGIRVPSAILNHGDSIQIGRHQLLFATRGGLQHAGPKGMPQAPYQAPAQPQVQPQMQPQPAPQPSAPALVALSGPLAGQRFPLHGPLVIGREGDLPLPDAQASRRHCSLTPVPGGVQLADLNSTNGTLVNGARVTQTFLAPGQVFQIGQSQFRVEA